MAIRYHHLNLDNSEEMQKVDKLEKILEIFKGIKKFEKFLNEYKNRVFMEDIDYIDPYFFRFKDYKDTHLCRQRRCNF
ncbi:hypothetical protein [Lebetimonas sp. JH292]|uniref:hypothetical protein n=1 Tax=Lebetimonas sp. JH292 TaxID=990068 RepID=UPI000466A220|nr:hypothetical protein [Lebetimonas sp. JH292]